MTTTSLVPASAPVVALKNGQAFTNSWDVAATFARLHKNVLRSIERIECSADFNQRNFTPIEYRDDRGRWQPSYEMTKDGFTGSIVAKVGDRQAMPLPYLFR